MSLYVCFDTQVYVGGDIGVEYIQTNGKKDHHAHLGCGCLFGENPAHDGIR